jgi:hypothetical protein
MNEYIRNGENGLLVDWEKPGRPPKGVDLRGMGDEARRTVERGYAVYRKALGELVKSAGAVCDQRWKPTFASLVAGVLYLLRHRVLRPLKRLSRRRAG